jgi:RNA polymerase sigma-70 factor, ECF subfamily
VSTEEFTNSKVEAAYHAGANVWPSLKLEPEVFARYVRAHTDKDELPKHTADMFLVCAALEGQREALAEIEKHFIAKVPAYVARVTVDRAVVDEVQQQLRTQLSIGGVQGKPKLLEYSGRGPLGAWLRMVAIRTTLNHLRGTGRVLEPDHENVGITSDAELAYAYARSDSVFAQAFKKVLEEVPAEARVILRFHYMGGLTMDQLAIMFKTSRSAIARRVAEARNAILANTERVLREDHGLAPSRIASMIRRADSQLNVTMSELLK